MKKHFDGHMGWRLLAIFPLIALTWSCATTSPSPSFQPIRDFKEVAGKWEGALCTEVLEREVSGCYPVMMILMEDGSAEVIVPKNSGYFRYSNNGRVPMIQKLVGGKIHVTNQITGYTGITTMRVIEGNRVLFYESTDESTKGELKPARK